jgi:hypothetical protein
MAHVDEAMVLARAKANSERDGFTWYLEIIRRPLSEARRRLYLEKARAELRREADASGPLPIRLH